MLRGGSEEAPVMLQGGSEEAPVMQWRAGRPPPTKYFVLRIKKRSTEDLSRRWARGPANLRNGAKMLGCNGAMVQYCNGAMVQ